MKRVYATTGKDGPKPVPIVKHAVVLTKARDVTVKKKIR